MLDSVFTARKYHWVEEPAPVAWLVEWFRRIGEWLEALRGADPIVYRVILAAMALVLAAFVVHAAWVLAQTVRRATVSHGVAARRRGALHDAAWHRREADQLATQGRYADALRAAFAALVLELDERHLVRVHPSKTPREYILERGLAEADRRRLGALVTALYAHDFGGAPCGPAEYARWRALADAEWHAAG